MINLLEQKGFCVMDLLAAMQQEIEDLHLKDEISIIDHLYRRTGEIFEYDSRFDFQTREKAFEIVEYENQKEVNIHFIEEFEILCTRWAKIFVKLLEAFSIKAEVIKMDMFLKHRYVRIFLSSGRTIIADLMIGLEDLVNIKLGKKVTNLCFEDDENKKAIKKDEKIEQSERKLENYLNQKKLEIEQKNLSSSEKLYQYFKIIELIINTPRPNVRYSSGCEILSRMLFYFLEKRYLDFTEFYNIEENRFARIYTMQKNFESIYFSYEECENKCFEFHEKTLEEIKLLCESDIYKRQRINFLNLPKEKGTSHSK